MKNLLFMCVANSARSQMAEALARRFLGAKANVFSAGSQPTKINPYAVEVLSELGIEVGAQHSKSVQDLPVSFGSDIDLVITLCAEEVCPLVPSGPRHVSWAMPDPAVPGLAPEEARERFRVARDQIRRKIETELLGLLEPHIDKHINKAT